MLLQGGFFIFGVKSRGPLTPVRKSYNHPDPLEPQPHDVDVKALLRIAAVYNIAIAGNRASADFVISSHHMNFTAYCFFLFFIGMLARTLQNDKAVRRCCEVLITLPQMSPLVFAGREV